MSKLRQSLQFWYEIFKPTSKHPKTKCQRRGHLWVKSYYDYGYMCGRIKCDAFLGAEEAEKRGWRIPNQRG